MWNLLLYIPVHKKLHEPFCFKSGEAICFILHIFQTHHTIKTNIVQYNNKLNRFCIIPSLFYVTVTVSSLSPSNERSTTKDEEIRINIINIFSTTVSKHNLFLIPPQLPSTLNIKAALVQCVVYTALSVISLRVLARSIFPTARLGLATSRSLALM